MALHSIAARTDKGRNTLRRNAALLPLRDSHGADAESGGQLPTAAGSLDGSVEGGILRHKQSVENG